MNLLPPDRYAKFLLIGLYLLIVAGIALRIKVEATHYTTPDSHFYLRAAENLNAGKGLVSPKWYDYPFDENSKEYPFSVWAGGYPALICLASIVTTASAFLASKLVNLLFLGLIFLLLARWMKNYTWFVALVFCSFGLLEVFSYTWSEGPFLYFVLLLCYLIHKDSTSIAPHPYLFLQLFGCLAALFLLRYAGLIYFFFAALYLGWHFYRKDLARSKHYFVALAMASLVVIAYFSINKYRTGHYTGGERIFPDAEPSQYIILKLFQGLFNEFAIIRNYYFRDYSDPLFVGLLLIQLVLLLYIILQIRKYNIKTDILAFIKSPLVQAGIFYLIMIVILRKYSPFDIFNYRILAPFSLPIYIYLFGKLTQSYNKPLFQRVYPWVTAFMLLSLFMNLPKAYILEQLFG